MYIHQFIKKIKIKKNKKNKKNNLFYFIKQ